MNEQYNMDKYIREQLNKVKVADLPYIDENTTEFLIAKKEYTPPIEIQVDHYYLIELQNYILNPPETFTLHINWNQNIIPKNKYYKCYCDNRMGKMIHILGVGFDYESRTDLDEQWDGWLPNAGITVLREI